MIDARAGPVRPFRGRAALRLTAAAPAVVGLASAAPLSSGTPHAPAQPPLSADTATATPPIPIISRGQWGADESLRRAAPLYDNAIRAGIIHHSATGNNYAPNESATIVRSIYAYHTRSMGWTDIAYNALVAARFNQPPTAEDVEEPMRGGAIFARWEALGGASGVLGPVRSPEAPGAGSARYVIFTQGAIYWSPATGAQPLTGAIYDTWATLGHERSTLGLPTSGQIQEPQWILQNFQHFTLNIDRENDAVTMVANGQPRVLPPPPPGGPPVQIERFSPARNRIP
ncbi:hypothetical protein [Mycolicibacterium tusciae]|uniref:hypothetical protein n=1 Tax=Mycolicibacterium tusciae TaxID=75922 RepID=UPI003C6E24FF